MFANYLMAGDWFSQYGMIIILGVFFVIMIVMTILPQRKQKKQQQAMMDSLTVGAKVMTIGGFVGTIVATDGQNFTLDVGPEGQPQYVVVIKSAIRQRMDYQPQPEQKQPLFGRKKNDNNNTENVENVENVTDVTAEENNDNADKQ